MEKLLPPDSVLVLLRKVKALADSGAPGEREAARARLAALLAKHQMTEGELTESEGRLHSFRFKTFQEQLLIFVVVANVATDRRSPPTYHGDGKRGKLWFKLTAAQIIDVETRVDFYRKHWEQEVGLFFRAFMFAQNLTLAADPDKPPRVTTDEQLREMRRVEGMKMFIDQRTPHRQLEAARR